MPRQQTVVVLLLPAPELKQRHDKRGRERWTGSDKEVVGYPTCLVSAACLCELRRDGPCPLGGDAPKNRANNFGPGSRLVAFRARGAHRAGGPRQLRAFPRAPTKKLIATSIFPNNPPDGGGPDGLPSLQWLHQWHARSAGGACSGPLFFLFSNEAPPQHVDAPSAKAQELRKKARANAAPNWLLCPEAPPHRRRRAACRPPLPGRHAVFASPPTGTPCGRGGVWPQCRPKRAARRTALRPPPPTPSHAPIALMRCSAARSRSLDGGALWFAVLCPPEVAPTCRPRSHRRARRPRPRPCPTPGRGVPPTPPFALATRSAWRFGTEGDTCSVACSASRSTGGVTLFSSLLVPLSSRSFLRSPALYRPTWYSLSLVV